MPEDTKVDIFADENKPRVADLGKITVYRVDIPNQHFDYYAVLWVREDGYCELHDFKFHGVPSPQQGTYNSVESYTQVKEVWDWLMEWELVELKPIGPEDSEYFITDQMHIQAALVNKYDEEAGY